MKTLQGSCFDGFISRQRITIVMVLGFLLPYLVYSWLPAVGIVQGLQWFSLRHLMLLPVCIGLLLSFCWASDYIRYRRPFGLAVLVIILWPYISGLYHWLSVSLEFYPPVRPLMLLITLPPVAYYLYRDRLRFWQDYPYLRYLLLFLGVTVFYYFFFNTHTTPMRMAGSSSTTEGDLSISSLYAYIWPIISVVVAGVTFRAISQEKRTALFDRFNQMLCWASVLTSLYAIIGYPNQWCSMVIDGYLRARGVFYHPNAHSHYLGLLMVYMSGLLMYYHYTPKRRISTLFLYITYTVNLLAFILGFSKTAFVAFLLGVLVLLIMQVRNPALWKRIALLSSVGLMLLGLAVGGFSLVSGRDFTKILEARVEDNSSLEFRQQLWQMAISNIGPDNIMFGHGLSSVNSLLQHQMFYGQRQNSVIDVHNGYLELLYNMGILGACFLMAFFSLIWSCIRYIQKSSYPPAEVLCYTIIAMCVYYLVGLSHEELLSFYPGLILVFGLPTILLTTMQSDKVWLQPKRYEGEFS